MNDFLILTFLFSVGSMTGWVLEVFYRRFVSQKHWVNPGFLVGPCLPLYGFSLCILYILASFEEQIHIANEIPRKALLFVLMGIAVTALEYTVGKIMITVEHIRLWDYSQCFGNIEGIICPQYTLYWILLSALYYFFIHPSVLDALIWLSQNLAFSFAIGFFYGILVIDFAYSAQLMRKMRQYADEHRIIIRLEALREEINYHLQNRRPRFLLSLKTERPFRDLLEDYYNKIQKDAKKESDRSNQNRSNT